MKTVKFFTLGCKVNQYDTQSMREQFLNSGFKELQDSQPADTYIINTCTVTHRSDAESLRLIRRAERENPKAKLVVTGCLTELDKDKIKKINKKIIIIRNKDKEKITQHLFRRFYPAPARRGGVYLSFKQGKSKSARKQEQGISYFENHTRAFLKIQDGCDNFCSYCKVPLVRGAPRSKSLAKIIEEAKLLAQANFKEIVLCGICLGLYGIDLGKKVTLVDVIDALENIDGLLRIRLSSIEAKDVSDKLIHTLAQSTKLCPHLHIPMQSGDDAILKRMNRKYSRSDYLFLVNKLRKFIPEIAITTDVLVGFSGESEANFKNTVDLIKEITPLKVHIFPYSERPGTYAASNFNEQVKPLVIKERIQRIRQVIRECSLVYKKQFLNQNMSVLIESRSKDNAFWQGYTDNYIKVLLQSNQDLKNKIIVAKLKTIYKDSVIGEGEI